MTSEARSLHETDEDGFHEIQLNGKQLVFLGMTTTLVSVVIFLCGVLVGRGVKPIEPVAEAASVTTAPAPTADTASPVEEPPPPVQEAASNAAAAVPAAGARSDAPVAKTPTPVPVSAETKAPARTAPAPVERLSYYDALQKGSGKPAASAKSTAATASKSPESTKPTAAAAPAPATPTSSGPTASPPPVAAPSASPADAVVSNPGSAPDPDPAPLSTGETTEAVTGVGTIAVQVAALTSRVDAEAIARRLSGKGYAAYVLAPPPGARQVFKVRVGNYTSADEAERVSRRLKQEEKLQPWVIR